MATALIMRPLIALLDSHTVKRVDKDLMKTPLDASCHVQYMGTALQDRASLLSLSSHMVDKVDEGMLKTFLVACCDV